jgi:hypothetical protein
MAEAAIKVARPIENNPRPISVEDIVRLYQGMYKWKEQGTNRKINLTLSGRKGQTPTSPLAKRNFSAFLREG